jgi:hypothetical protein
MDAFDQLRDLFDRESYTNGVPADHPKDLARYLLGLIRDAQRPDVQESLRQTRTGNEMESFEAFLYRIGFRKAPRPQPDRRIN